MYKRTTYRLDRSGRYELGLKVERVLRGGAPAFGAIIGRHGKGRFGTEKSRRCRVVGMEEGSRTASRGRSEKRPVFLERIGEWRVSLLLVAVAIVVVAGELERGFPVTVV